MFRDVNRERVGADRRHWGWAGWFCPCSCCGVCCATTPWACRFRGGPPR